MTSAARLVDAVAEATVVPSFTRIGYDLRRRLDGWTSLDRYDATGRVVLLTGGTSGIGRAAAAQLARCGATVVVVGRNDARNEAVVAELVEETGNPLVSQVPADLGALDQVRDLADRVRRDHERVDVLVHNAGALLADRQEAPDGTEATVASQVVGPFLLTALLLDRLADAAPSRVLTVSSGGMYAAGLSTRSLEMAAGDYRGTEQYARAKRAQVVLNELWAERFGDRGIHFHALHPGWVDTPGVDDALPTFARVLGPALRTPAQGADSLVWLACADDAIESNGRFWHDRRIRPIHKLPSTRRSDTPEARAALWDWVVERCGLEPA